MQRERVLLGLFVVMSLFAGRLEARRLSQYLHAPPEIGDFGKVVESVGDVNGDGVIDVVVREGLHGQGPWVLYLFLVQCDGTLGPAPAASITGPVDSDTEERFGEAFGGADLDGDGFSDVVVLQAWYISNASCLDGDWSCYYCNQGRILVFRGGPSGLSAPALTADMADWEITGESGVHQPGSLTAFATGDVSDDGIADLIVTDFAWDPETRWCFNYQNDPSLPRDLEGDLRGRILIFEGGDGLGGAPRVIEPPPPHPSAQFNREGIGVLGDVDGVSGADIGISAEFYADGVLKRGVQVFDGSSGEHRYDVRADLIDENSCCSYGMWFDRAVGDVNGDGLGDFTARSHHGNGGGAQPVLYSFLGSETGPVRDFRVADTAWEFNVRPAGDWNGDGLGDVLSTRWSGADVQLTIRSGSTSGLAPWGEVVVVDTSDCDLARATHAASVGDLDGDGYGELAVGRPSWDPSTCGSRLDLIVSDDVVPPPPPPPSPCGEAVECCAPTGDPAPDGISVSIAELSFLTATTIHEDRREPGGAYSPYDPPHWRDLDGNGTIAATNACLPPPCPDPPCLTERAFPVVFTAGECIQVQATFKLVDLPLNRTCVFIRGYRGEELFFEGNADAVDGVITTPVLRARAPLIPAIAVYDPMSVRWEVSFDRGGTWQPAGTTQNRVYVTLAPARGNSDTGDKLLETPLDIACRAAIGHANPAMAMERVWSAFEGAPNSRVKRKLSDGHGNADGARLVFWADERTADPALLDLIQVRDTVPTLLDPCEPDARLNGRGTCAAFVWLLDACWSAVGLDASSWEFYEITATYRFASNVFDGAGMLIKKWTFQDPGTYSCLAPFVNWTNRFGPPECAPAPGVVAQGIDNPHSQFKNHFVVVVDQWLEEGRVMLDPSYGTKFSTESDWEENSVDGFGGECWQLGRGRITGTRKNNPALRETNFERGRPS